MEIWCEGDPLFGYTACHLGYGKGETLLEACKDLASKPNRVTFRKYFDPAKMTYIGCKIFNNEAEARDSWG